VQFIIDDSIWQRLDIIEDFLLNAQNQLQIFREGLMPGGAFDDNTRGPIPPVYNYPVYQQNLAVPRIAPGIVALGGDDDDSDGIAYLHGSEDDDDSGADNPYGYGRGSDDSYGVLPPPGYSDDGHDSDDDTIYLSDDGSADYHSLGDSYSPMPTAIDWGVGPGSTASAL
jgi:hypothetical protein